jgi:hypothetical protein
MSNSDEMPTFNLVDELSMLLNAVAEAATTSGIKNACEIIAQDQYAQAHFAVVSSKIKDITGMDAALIEYGSDSGNLEKTITDNTSPNKANWAIWNRIV